MKTMTHNNGMIWMCRTAAAALAIAAGSVASAQCGAIKMIAAQPTSDDAVGGVMAYGVDTAGGSPRLIVGSPEFNLGGFFDSGNVKMFTKIGNQWGELTEFFKPTQAFDGDRFGAAVAYNGQQVLIGAPGVQSGRGAAYIYAFQQGWTAVATIASSQVLQRVGEATAMDGEYAFIGAPGTDSANDNDTGLVSIYKRAANGSWSQVQTLINASFTGLYGNDQAGAALAAKDGLLVVGAPEATEIGWPNFHGLFRVYRRDAAGVYQLEQDSVFPAAQGAAQMGRVLATDGTRIAVSARDYSTVQNVDGSAFTRAGKVWVLARVNGQWVVEDALVSPSPAFEARFGSSLAIDGDKLVVGEPGSKRAYAYRRLNDGQWALMRSYSDEDAAAGGQYASSVALSGQNVFVADNKDDHSGQTDAGAIYIKPIPSGYADACEGALPMTGATLSGCTRESTPDAVPTCGATGNTNTASGPGVWVSWIPACSGNVIFDTFGSTFDTVLSVHTACPTAEAPAVVACDDDSGTGNTSILSFNYTAGTQYLINVRGYGSATGDFVLRRNEWQAPSNDACSSAIAVQDNSVTAFNTCLATASNLSQDGACNFSNNWGRDVWYTFTPPFNGTLVVDTCGSSFDTLLAIYTGSCPQTGTGALVCSDDSPFCGALSTSSRIQQNNLAGGLTYVIRVGGFGVDESGAGQLRINFLPACRCDVNENGQLTVQDIFDFLSAWFAQQPAGDFNLNTQFTVQDIFDFLACWFGGCP